MNSIDTRLFQKDIKMENAIPTDSVLKRHYEATHGKTTQSKSAASNSSGGFMSWLKKLFGG